MLGARPVDVFAFESFGEDWGHRHHEAAEGRRGRRTRPATASCRTSAKARKDADIVFTWNGTTSGVKVPNGDWIAG
jgi:phosphoserine aminotransferase